MPRGASFRGRKRPDALRRVCVSRSRRKRDTLAQCRRPRRAPEEEERSLDESIEARTRPKRGIFFPARDFFSRERSARRDGQGARGLTFLEMSRLSRQAGSRTWRASSPSLRCAALPSPPPPDERRAVRKRRITHSRPLDFDRRSYTSINVLAGHYTSRATRVAKKEKMLTLQAFLRARKQKRKILRARLTHDARACAWPREREREGSAVSRR